MKKIISIILVAAIMLGFIAMTISVASAEALPEVVITGVTAPVVGQTATTEGIVCDNPNLTLLCNWYCLSDGDVFRNFTGVFEENKAYALNISVAGNDNVQMETETTVFSVNGQSPDYVKRYWSSRYDTGMIYELGQVERVDTVMIEQMPQLVEGESVTDAQILSQFRLAEGLKVFSYQVYRYDGQDMNSFEEGTLEKKKYEIILRVGTEAGCGYLDGFAAELAWPDVPYDCRISNRFPGYVEIRVTVDLRTEIEQVEVSGITIPKKGEGFTTEGIVLPQGLTVDQVKWWNYTEDREVAPDEKLEIGTYYGLQLSVGLLPGYVMDVSDDDILINGYSQADMDDLSVNTYYEGGFDVYWDVGIEMPAIRSVQLEGVPEEIRPGAVPALNVTAMHPQAKVVTAQWQDSEGDPVTTFETGKRYRLYVETEVDENFHVLPWSNLFTRNKETEDSYGEGQMLYGYFAYSTAKLVQPVVTTGGIAPGEKVEDIKITPCEGVEVVDVWVWDVDAYEEPQSFVNGKSYRVMLKLQPKEGYTFQMYDDVLVDGEEPDHYSVDSDFADAEFYVIFGQKIDTASVTVPEPKAGDEIVAPTVPQNVGYELGYWEYYDCHTGEYVTEGKFQAGHKYSLQIELYSKAGYVFDKDAKTLLNGEESEDSYVNYDYAGMEQMYSFAKTIDKVELPAWPSLKVGDLLKGTFGADADGKYSYHGVWMDDDYEPIDENISAVNGYQYDYEYTVTAAPGYDITDDTKFFVGGQEIPRWQWNRYSGNCEGRASKAYPLGMKPVDTVKLEMEEPELGKEVAPQITLDEDAPYYVFNAFWSRGKTDDPDLAKWLNDDKTFQYGYYYFLTLNVDTDQGYAFGDKVKVIVNGEELEGCVRGNYGNTLDVCVPAGLFTDNPKTGDESPVLAVAALMVLAMAGLAVTVIGKKRMG